MHSSSGTKRFRKPRALGSGLAMLGTLHPALGFLNHVVPSTQHLTLFNLTNKYFQGESSRFNINPLLDANIRALVSQVYVEGMMAGIVSRTMNSKTHGPTISVQRITIE